MLAGQAAANARKNPLAANAKHPFKLFQLIPQHNGQNPA
jgi:hypothetical protein